MILVKGIHATSFAYSDEDYERIVNANTGFTIYQIGRVVRSEASLDSTPLEKALISLRYGELIAVVEHIDCDGNLIPLNDNCKSVTGGYSSRYMRVLQIFDMRTAPGVNALFDFADAHGVKFTHDGGGHVKRNELGDEAYRQIYQRLGLAVPEEWPVLDSFPKRTIPSPADTRSHDAVSPQSRSIKVWLSKWRNIFSH